MDDRSSTSIASLAGSASSAPLYQEVRLRMTRALAAGDWKAGDLIPSEVELARRFGVSKGTVRRALDDLVAEKILVRRQGRGTFVATHSTDRAIYHFFHLIGRDGSREVPTAKTLSYRIVKGSDDACDRLQIPRNSKLINVHNLVGLRGGPVFMDDILIPQPLFRGLTEKVFSGRESTIYALYQSRFNISVVRISEQLAAGHAPAVHAKVLRIGRTTPVLVIDRVAYTYQDKPVELRRSWVNTAAHVYLSDLVKT
jgi:GntR family transcriptional regulator